MMVTVEKAGKTYCPEVQASCIGSKCMMWRWGLAPHRLVSRSARDGWEHVSAEEAVHHELVGECWIEPPHETDARRGGYCGLAGKVDHA